MNTSSGCSEGLAIASILAAAARFTATDETLLYVLRLTFGYRSPELALSSGIAWLQERGWVTVSEGTPRFFTYTGPGSEV